jgi:hypothetical protein
MKTQFDLILIFNTVFSVIVLVFDFGGFSKGMLHGMVTLVPDPSNDKSL